MDEYLAHSVALEPAGRGQGADRISASNPLLLLLGATVLVLLIVCVSVTNATGKASNPPTTANTADSLKSCPISRPRLAPIDARIASWTRWQ